jgi:hypothetical protein
MCLRATATVVAGTSRGTDAVVPLSTLKLGENFLTDRAMERHVHMR